MDMKLSDDKLLGGRLTLLQPEHGHRAGIDAVLLAAAVPAKTGELVLEGGTGVGSAGLCLAKRVQGIRIDAIEIDPGLAQLAAQNAERNGLKAVMEIHCGDIAAPPYRLMPGAYDHVFMNPPFQEELASSASPQPGRVQAHQEGAAVLIDWIKFAVNMSRAAGCITMIHRADRLDDILAALKGRAGGCQVFPLWPGADKPAKRVIIRAYKGNAGPLQLHPGLVLHETEKKYTDAAEAVLRHAQPLTF